MLAQSPAGGAIVNVSSVNGLGGAPGGALYSAAKAGVLALTKSAAQEFVDDAMKVPGVNVNAGEGGLLGLAVSPGYAKDRLVYAYFTTDSDNRIATQMSARANAASSTSGPRAVQSV